MILPISTAMASINSTPESFRSASERTPLVLKRTNDLSPDIDNSIPIETNIDVSLSTAKKDEEEDENSDDEDVKRRRHLPLLALFLQFFKVLLISSLS